jgi:hypothetical protein
MKSTTRKYRVDRREIAFLRFIFDGYDGIAVVTTLDPDAGIVVLRIPSGCEREVDMILQAIGPEILIEPVPV